MTTPVPGLRCGLCGQSIDARADYFRATGDFLPPDDPLLPFSNVPLHWTCYADWPERPRFARHYVRAWQEANRKNPFWWSVLADDRVYVSVNPDRPIEEVSIRLFDVGSDIRVPLRRWAEWLAHPERVTPGLRAVEKAGLTQVLPLLRQRFPDDHAVVDAIDPNEKNPEPRRKAGHGASPQGPAG